MRIDRFGGWAFVFVGVLLAAGAAEAKHWQFAYEELGHATPIEGFYQASAECLAECEPLANDPEAVDAFKACTAKHRCQPLIALPPNPDVNSGACLESDAIADDGQFEAECRPFSRATTHSKRSCCLQYEITRQGWRGYQLVFGPYDMDATVNDEFTCGYARVPNAGHLDAEDSTYEYMIAFEFWQYSGSHHFIMDDIIGRYNDPDNPRDCTGDAECARFDSLPERFPAAEPRRSCEGPGMSSFPLAGSPGPSYFPVPYPDDVGIKISREHIFRMTHHLQDWFDPQRAQVWINVYTRPAKDASGEETIRKEAHVFFDGSGSVFLVPPHTIGRTQGVWVAPRNIELYGVTAHSHKRNVLFTADLIGVDGNVKALPVRTYQYSSPYCGGFRRIPSGPDGQPMPDDPVDTDNPPRHLYESTDWADHESCPWWREDGSNDAEGAVLIRQGEGIRYECFVNNGVLPFRHLRNLSTMSPDPTVNSLLGTAASIVQGNASSFPAGTLAFQAVPIEPRDAFGNVVRGKFSCEEIPGVIPGFPGAGAVGYYHNRPCLPDVLKDQDPTEDLNDADSIRALLEGGEAAECDPNDGWRQFCGGYGCAPDSFPFAGNYTGKCVPASIGFAETEDDEMCIFLGLYAFTDDDVVPIGKDGPLGENGIDRLPTDVGR